MYLIQWFFSDSLGLFWGNQIKMVTAKKKKKKKKKKKFWMICFLKIYVYEKDDIFTNFGNYPSWI